MPKIEEELELDLDLEIEEPKLFNVLLHNDDYTSMDFVVHILIKIFSKSQQEAEFITMEIHKKKYAICGTYTFEIAQTKVGQVMRLAKERDFPLLATVEEES